MDVWGRFADADRTISWQRDTITNVWSVTKTMTAQAPQWEPGRRGRIPLAHPGVRSGRGRAPDHRPEPGRLLRSGGGRTAGCRLRRADSATPAR
ncbi:MAG: hypothetical protein ACRDOU_11915 [Streptosporangiaceae bacterium]